MYLGNLFCFVIIILFKELKWSLSTLIDMVITFYHIILTVKVLDSFLLEWVGFCESLGWKTSILSGNTATRAHSPQTLAIPSRPTTPPIIVCPVSSPIVHRCYSLDSLVLSIKAWFTMTFIVMFCKCYTASLSICLDSVYLGF